MGRIAVEDVQAIWYDHQDYCRRMRPEWLLNRACFRTKMWEEGKPHNWDLLEARKRFPLLIEINRVEPFVSAMVSSLFARRPRSNVTLPSVYPSKPGAQPDTQQTSEQVQGLLDAWLVRANVQQEAMDAYSVAMLYEAAGFRLGIEDQEEGEDGQDPLDRIWLETLPRWECLWDRKARRGQERYRGHVAMRQIETLREDLGDKLENIKPIPLADYLLDGWLASNPSSDSRQRGRAYAGYVRVIEFYDLGSEDSDPSQSFYAVQGSGDATTIIPIGGEPTKVPWFYPDGRPAVPLIPAVLVHDPESPLSGIPAVRRIVQLNVNQNTMSTVMMNMASRDSARKMATDEGGGVDDVALAQLTNNNDAEVVRFKRTPDDQARVALDKVVVPLQFPPIPTSVPQVLALLENGWKEAAGASENQQGRQNKYTSAAEAKLLAMYGERAASQVQAQMQASVAELGRLVLTVLRSDLENRKKTSLTVRQQGTSQKVTVEALRLPWEVEIADAGSTPIGDEARVEKFMAAMPQLLKLASLAFGVPEVPGGDPPNPAVQIMAKRMLDRFVALADVGEEFASEAIADAVRSTMQKAKKLTDRAGPDSIAAASSILGPGPGGPGPQGAQGPISGPPPPPAPRPSLAPSRGIPGGGSPAVAPAVAPPAGVR